MGPQPARSVFAVLAITALLAPALAGVPTARASSEPIQPGDAISTSIGGCTLNFVFDSLATEGPHVGKVWIGTAAHCVAREGERVWTTGIGPFGTVDYMGDSSGGERNGRPGAQSDFALILVDAHLRGNVRASLKGHPTLPTGGLQPSVESKLGDRVQFSGYGTGYSLTFATREQRVGVLVHQDLLRYSLEGPIIYGDSGGPVVHASGRALGIVSIIDPVPLENSLEGHMQGPTVEGVIRELAPLGFALSLRSV
ncbi:MAG TPA: trypsin-like peptidase domain-containing protein [Candidatus Thermoplasmatota archaeon]|nr:trypsin-like peptidase domain-containing protein [Candidatus Thermoplasmatota archaeon]